MTCEISGLFLIPGPEHLLLTNVFYTHMWPFGYLHLSPPVKMASCLLMTGVQLLGQGGNLTLPCKYHFIAEHLPLLPATRGTWILDLGSNQPPDFQMMPALDSWLGCLRECRDRSELSLSEGDALAQQGLCKHQPQQEPVVTKLRPNCKTNTFQQGSHR